MTKEELEDSILSEYGIVYMNHSEGYADLRSDLKKEIDRLVNLRVSEALMMYYKGKIKVKKHPTIAGKIEFIFPPEELKQE